MNPFRRWDRNSRILATAAGVVALGAAAAGVAALRVSPPAWDGTAAPARPVPASPGDARPPSGTLTGADGGSAAPLLASSSDTGPVPDSLVTAAVAGNVFRPDRRPAAERYLPPTARSSRREGGREVSRRLDRFRLVGTAARGDGRGTAAFHVGGGSPRIVGVGGLVEGFRVTRVEEGRVTLTLPDTSVLLELAAPRDGRGGGR